MCYLHHLFAGNGWQGRVAKSCMENVPMFQDRGDFHTRVAESEFGDGVPPVVFSGLQGAILGHVSKPGVTLYLRGCVHPAKANLCLGNILSYRSPVTLKENKNSLEVLNGNIFLPNNVQIMLHDII